LISKIKLLSKIKSNNFHGQSIQPVANVIFPKQKQDQKQ